MKRLPLSSSSTAVPTTPGGRVYAQTQPDLAGDPRVDELRAREFAEANSFEPPPGVDRRTFLTLMGASMALAGMATGCRRPEEKILPYSRRPEDLVDGRPVEYATSVPFYGTAIGLLVESTDGRPTKIEGNPAHPESLGGTTAPLQALLLDLYDPDRSKTARTFQGVEPGAPAREVSVADAWAFLGRFGEAARQNQGAGLAVLVEDHRSPTTKAATDALLRAMPQAKVFRYEALGRENVRSGAQWAFGQPLEPVYAVDQADVLVVLDGDILASEGSPIKASKQFSKRRRVEDGAMNRIYVAEACPTPTGTVADHRLRVAGRRVIDLARALTEELGKHGVEIPTALLSRAAGALSATEQAFVQAAAKDLAAAKGRGLLVAGRRQPAQVHALTLALNALLGNVGKTVMPKPLYEPVNEGAAALADFTAAMLGEGTEKQIQALVILGGNPVFNAPGDVRLREVLERARKPKGDPQHLELVSVHLSTHYDETSELCTWHVPRAHFLESWSDTTAEDGTLAVTQPLIAPLYDGKTDAEVLEHLAAGMRSSYDLVRATWGTVLGADLFEQKWRKVLHEGVLPGSAHADVEVTADTAKVGLATRDYVAPEGAFDVVFAPDAHAYDGRFANNGWMQELPDPIHKMCWMNAAAVSHATATKLGVADGDMLEVTVGGKSVKLPAVVTYGHADDSVTLTIGMGRRFAGSVCQGVGVDTQGLRAWKSFTLAAGDVKKTAGHEALAVTQGHFVLEGRPLVREQTVAEHTADPTWAKNLVKHPPLLNLFADWEYPGHKWGMAIDLTLCTGCSACVTACQAENNIPVIGIQGVLKSREMHWLRIDRYFAGMHGVPEHADETMATSMPMTCQHCENAPCEQVCPVAATTHSPEGINEMTYNRCIGTKYCGNNCPYKVRRFNYFHYTAEIPETVKLGLNPDVTVRSRGVMEKCTFCVQRVNQVKIAAKKEADPEKGKAIVRSLQSACQQACPTDAISFGDLNDAGQAVGHKQNLPRAYKVLQELNVRPRISYLARIRNPNPELEPAAAAAPAKPAAAAPAGGHDAHGEAH